jgi:hypothetical protein
MRMHATGLETLSVSSHSGTWRLTFVTALEMRHMYVLHSLAMEEADMYFHIDVSMIAFIVHIITTNDPNTPASLY